ncbi:MAG: hypothetical protein ACRDHY_15435 [Anaerolineales bacterium]
MRQLNAKLDTALDRSVAEHAFAQFSGRIDKATADVKTELEQRLGPQWLLGAWSAEDP